MDGRRVLLMTRNLVLIPAGPGRGWLPALGARRSVGSSVVTGRRIRPRLAHFRPGVLSATMDSNPRLFV